MFAPKDQNSGRAWARGLTRHHHGVLTRGLRRAAAGAVCAAAVATLPLSGAAVAQAAPTTSTAFTLLTLVNGWHNYLIGTARAAVASINGIVYLKGGIKTSGTNPVPFTLPPGDRPAHKVYVPVDLCRGANGRLDVAPTGVVTVETEGGTHWGNAQCYTSLDGVSFAPSASSFTKLTLKNGWVNYGFGTASPAARKISGIVHLEGAMRTKGLNQVAFTLPPGDRPALRVFVPIDLCGGANGDLFIQGGSVYVEAEGGVWSNAQCFTSLDGVSFAPSASSFTPLTLQNGWTNTGLASATPAVRVISGMVHLEGDMYTNSINPVPFTLPAGFRPAHNVAVKVALCGRDSGELIIGPGGQATVQAAGGNWTNAQCQTALDGVWFAR